MATSSEAEQQDANIQPPRRGETIAFAVNATPNPIDLKLLAFNEQPHQAAQKEFLYVTLANDSATTAIYYYLSKTNVTTGMDPAAAVAAGVAPTWPRTSDPWVLFPQTKEPIRIQRDVDLFLIVRTASGTSTLRATSSSGSTKQQL